LILSCGPGRLITFKLSTQIIEYTELYSRLHHGAIRVYDKAGSLMEMYQHHGISGNSEMSNYSANETGLLFTLTAEPLIPVMLTRAINVFV